jgi:hypothetical protein
MGSATICASAAGFAPAATALFGFTAAAFGAAVDLGSALPGFASFQVVVTLRFLGASVTGWEVGLGVGAGTLALTNRPLGRRSSSTRPGHQLCSGTCPLRLQGERIALRRPEAVARRTLRKCSPPFLPFHETPVVRRVAATTATALRRSLTGLTLTSEVRANTRDAPRGVFAVPLRVAEALAALALQSALCRHVRLYRHSQTTKSTKPKL